MFAYTSLSPFTFVSRTGETDQLLADIDDMLADLNTHLDFMIPGADEGTEV